MGQAEKVDLAGLQVGQTLTIQPVNTGEIIGYGYMRGNPNMIIETGVEVVFMMGYDNKPFVLTSYPVYMQPPPSPPHAPGHGFAP